MSCEERLDLVAYAGLAFDVMLKEPIAEGVYRSFADFEFLMQVRPYAGSGTVIAEFSTADGSITIEGDELEEIHIHLSASETADLEPGTYVFDLVHWQETNRDDATSYLNGAGRFIVRNSVTEAFA